VEVAIPPPPIAVPLSAISGDKFTQRFPGGVPIENSNNDDDLANDSLDTYYAKTFHSIELK